MDHQVSPCNSFGESQWSLAPSQEYRINLLVLKHCTQFWYALMEISNFYPLGWNLKILMTVCCLSQVSLIDWFEFCTSTLSDKLKPFFHLVRIIFWPVITTVPALGCPMCKWWDLTRHWLTSPLNWPAVLIWLEEECNGSGRSGIRYKHWNIKLYFFSKSCLFTNKEV